MAMQKLGTCWKAALVFAVSVGGMTACSSKNTDEDVLAPSAEGDGESPAAIEAAADDEAKSAPAALTDGSVEEIASAPADIAMPVAPVGGAAEGEAASVAAPTNAGAAQVAAAPAKNTRVVRHVKVQQAQLRAAPSATAKSVGRLVRGDHVLVDVEKDWGRIGDGLYIRLSDTADKPVAVKRQRAVWTPPAH